MFNFILFSNINSKKPCDTNLISYYTKTVTASGTLSDLLHKNRHTAIKAQYVYMPEGTTISGFNSSATLVTHSGTAALELLSGVITCTSSGSMFDLTLDTGEFYSCGEGYGDILYPEDTSDSYITYTSSSRQESIEEGHSWNLDSFLLRYDGAYLPEDYYVDNGGSMTGTICKGAAAQNFDIYGYTCTFSGSEYLEIDSLTTSDSVVSYTGTADPYIEDGKLLFNAGWTTSVELSNGIKLIIESMYGSDQDFVYDVNNQTRYTLYNYNEDLWSKRFKYTSTVGYLARKGGVDATTYIIPYKGNDTSRSFTGIFSAPSGTFSIKAPYSPEVYSSPDASQFYVQYEPQYIDPASIVASDTLIKTGKGMALLWEPQISGCADKTSSYFEYTELDSNKVFPYTFPFTLN